MTKTDKDLLSINEVASLLNLHPNTLRAWDKKGILRAVRIGTGTHRRYRRQDVERIINKSRYVQGADEAQKVGGVRRGYFEEFSDFLIKYAELGPGSSIVDVPCGNGGMSAMLQSKGIGQKYYLVDINADMLEAAAQNVSGNTMFVQGDAAHIDILITGKVDRVLCLNGFHIYIDKKEEFLKAAKNVLNDNGLLVFDVSTRGLDDEKSATFLSIQGAEMTRLAKERGSAVDLPTWPNRDSFAHYRELIKESGLTLVRTVTFETWEDPEVMINNTLAIPGRLRPWLPDLHEDERVEIFRQASATAKQESKLSLMSHSRMFFIIRK